MKRVIAGLLLSVFFVFRASAQFDFWPDNKEGVEAVKMETLIVMLAEPDSKVVKKLTPEQKDIYKAQIKEYNNLLQTSVKKYWTIQKNFDFKTKGEITKMVKQNKGTKYLILSIVSTLNSNPYEGWDPYDYALVLAANGKFKHDEYIIHLGLGNRAETDVEFRFLFTNLAKYLQAFADGKRVNEPSLFDAKKNEEVLAKKTLLFDEDMLDTALITKEKATAAYVNKNIEFLNGQQIYERLASGDTNVLFMTYTFNQPFNMWMYTIVDNANMQILCLDHPAEVYFGPNVHVHMKGEFDEAFTLDNPGELWLNRKKLKLNAKDFKHFGSHKSVETNYYFHKKQ